MAQWRPTVSPTSWRAALSSSNKTRTTTSTSTASCGRGSTMSRWRGDWGTWRRGYGGRRTTTAVPRKWLPAPSSLCRTTCSHSTCTATSCNYWRCVGQRYFHHSFLAFFFFFFSLQRYASLQRGKPRIHSGMELVEPEQPHDCHEVCSEVCVCVFDEWELIKQAFSIFLLPSDSATKTQKRRTLTKREER